MSTPPMIGKSRSGAILAPIVFFTAIIFLNFIARVIPAPLLPSIEKDMQISHCVAG